jgi:hypothetical protein
MQALSGFQPGSRSRVAGLLTDIDDTITTSGG